MGYDKRFDSFGDRVYPIHSYSNSSASLGWGLPPFACSGPSELSHALLPEAWHEHICNSRSGALIAHWISPWDEDVTLKAEIVPVRKGDSVAIQRKPEALYICDNSGGYYFQCLPAGGLKQFLSDIQSHLVLDEDGDAVVRGAWFYENGVETEPRAEV